MFEIEVRARDSLARQGVFHTPRGSVETPALMPVYNPNIPLIEPGEMRRLGAQMLITNAYIISRSPGLRERALREGLHALLGFEGPIMTDSGAFQSHVYGDARAENLEIVDFQVAVGSDIVTIFDVFVEPDFPREEVERAISENRRRVREAMERVPEDRILAAPVHGGLHHDLREECARSLAELGYLYHPVGGIVPLMEQYRFDQVIKALLATKRGLPPDRPVHLFGAGHPMFFPLAVLAGADFFDSASYAKFAKQGRILTPWGSQHINELKGEPPWSSVWDRYTLREVREMPEGERTRILALHNLEVSLREMREIRRAIREESIWEYVEMKVRAHPALLSAYRALLGEPETLMPYENSSRRRALFYTGPETLRRPSVRLFRERLRRLGRLGRRAIAVPHGPMPLSKFLPMPEGFPEVMPYSVTPLGPIPVVVEDCYPASQSLFPWPPDRTSAREVEEGIKALVELYGGNAEIADGYEGGEWDLDRLNEEKARAIAVFQFGKGAAEALLDGDLRVVYSRSTGKLRNVYVGGEHVLSLRAADGLYTLKLAGGRRLHRTTDPPRFRVIVNEESAPFNAEGRNVFAPFVVDADPGIRPGDEVLVVDEGDNLLAVGRALLSGREMLHFRRGMAVNVKDHVSPRTTKGGR